MTRWERWTFNALHAVVGVTGFVYVYMQYVLVTDDPFAIINHPWQPATLAIHVVAAPVYIAFFGMLFRSHTLRKLRVGNPANRRSGWTSIIGFSVMALSGYLIQVGTTPAFITFSIWLHIGAGTLFVVSYGVHLVNGWRIKGQPVGPSSNDLAAAPFARGASSLW